MRAARRQNLFFPALSEASNGKTQSPCLDHLAQTITAYTTLTRNPWSHSDTVSYLQNSIDRVPIERVKQVLQIFYERSEARINSFAYFVKEILASDNYRTRAARRKALAKIVRRVRDSHRGNNGYSTADLVCDVKAACAREGVPFDNDLFKELV